jgi:hypothetical protein
MVYFSYLDDLDKGILTLASRDAGVYIRAIPHRIIAIRVVAVNIVSLLV